MDRTKIIINNKEMEIYVDYDKKNIWLSKKEIAELFGVNVTTIRYVFRDKNDLLRAKMLGVGEKMLAVGINGKTYKVDHFNQDVIYEIGYNINPDIVRELNGILDELFAINETELTLNNSLTLANSYDLVRYENGEILLDVNVSPSEDTVWLNQNEIAKLFDSTKQTISYHINNIFESNELTLNRVVKDFLTTANDGKKYNVSYYNLDMIISIGYRVNTKRGIEFRRWATSVLKNYLLNGYSINEKRCLECSDNIISLSNKVEYLLGKTKGYEERLLNLEKPEDLFSDKLFYEGEIYDAYSFIKELFLKAKEKIIIIDGYIDITVLDMLKSTNVNITIYTFPSAKLTKQDINKFKQNHTLEVNRTKIIHDRFIIIDDEIYSCGSSIKDAGKKRFVMCKITSFKELELLKDL